MAENVIELNGKRYDAVTGAYLGVSHTFAEPATAPPVTSGQVIDGFMRPETSLRIKEPATTTPAELVKPKKHIPEAPHTAQPHNPAKYLSHDKEHGLKRKPAEPAKAHHPEHSKTLMRRAVHKPEAPQKPAIRAQTPAEVAAKPLSAIAPKRSALQVDKHRLERAKAIGKHNGIRHFTATRSDYSPADTVHHAATHRATIIPVQAAPTSRPGKRQHADIFEAAIVRAQSHKQAPPKRTHHSSHHRRLTNVMAGIGAFLVIGGFVTYLNIPNIQLHVASVTAGFKADIPAYTPTGYALKGGVQRIGNTVSLQFRAGENSFTLTQQSSNWNSQTLLDSTTALSTGTYKTVEIAGRTVYVYKDKNAVWVNNGVRYDLNSNARLSSGEIAHIAASL